MTPLDLARLSELAEKAWAGRWFAEHSSSNEPFVAWVHNYSGTVIGDIHTFEDAAFIAAFDPTTAKALLSEVVALRGALRTTQDALGEAARDAHALAVRHLPNTTCIGDYETCSGPVCPTFRAPRRHRIRREGGRPVTGSDLIAIERHRQIGEEGYDAIHDAGHADELALAAACYALPNERRKYREDVQGTYISGPVSIALWGALWPWSESFWKPGDRIRELVKAGALIAAAIDSLRAVR